MLKPEKIKIGVLMGGISAEREVSFNSGRTICDHLDATQYDVIPIFQNENGLLYILPWRFLHRGKSTDFSHRLTAEAQPVIWDALKEFVDFIYSTLHGFKGEDGVLQGVLELFGIPYLGSKVYGGAAGMDKAFAKKIFQQHKIETPKCLVLRRQDIDNLSTIAIVKQLDNIGISLPYIVKPVHEGSSLGVSCVENLEQLPPALLTALIGNCPNASVLIEEKIVGMEFVATLVQKSDGAWSVLPLTEIIPEMGTHFFDYEQKYMPGRAQKITPARCTEAERKLIDEICIATSKALNFATISRVDGFLTSDGRVIIIDTQPFPNMSPTAFIFQQAAVHGMNHTHFINYLIEQELIRESSGSNQNLKYKKEALLKNDAALYEVQGGSEVKKKLRIAVLLGGESNEREISLESGRNICYKLSPQKYDVAPLFVGKNSKLYELTPELLIQNKTDTIAELVTEAMLIEWSLLSTRFDFVFIGLHGGNGENGSVQAMLEMLGLPYNGSGVLSSALCINKFQTNQFLAGQGFDVPRSMLISASEWKAIQHHDQKKVKCAELASELGYPLILKPHDDGCSVMVKKIKDDEQFVQALDQYFTGNKEFSMVESFVPGVELTCAVLGNCEPAALPPSMVVTKSDILSIEEKFLPGEGENQTPALIPASAIALTQETVEKAFQALGCRGYARIDCFYQNPQQSSTGKERIVILEVNTLPGMTPATCIFHQAAEIGLRPMEFIDKIIELGMQNHVNA